MRNKQTRSFWPLSVGLLCISATQIALADPINNIQTSDLVVSIWDSTTSTSYTADLGIGANAFLLEDGSNQSFQLDSYFSNWLSTTVGTDQLTFNVFGVNQVSAKTSSTDEYIISYPEGGNYLTGTTNYNAISSYQNRLIELITGSFNTDSEVVSSTSSAYFNSSLWGIGQGSSGVNDSTTVGGSGTIQVGSSFLPNNQLAIAVAYVPQSSSIKNTTTGFYSLPVGYFSLNISTSQLLWTAANPTAVPLPTAAWLFIGGVLSVLGIRKSKLQQALSHL